MLVLTLLTINVVLVLNTVTDKAVGAVQDRIEVSVYFTADTTQERVQTAVQYLRGLPQVRDVGTISSEEALERFTVRHQNDVAILESLEEIEGNPFGPTLVIKAFSASDFEFIIDALDNPQFRDNIRDKDFTDYERIIEKIRYTTDRIKMFGYGLSAIFLLIAILIIFNTIRMGIIIHREEIGIMKLVGASNWFVRAPFLFESVIFSAIATLIVIAVMYPVLSVFEPKLDLYLDGATTQLTKDFIENGWKIFGIQFVGLALLNMFATSAAMKKYLRV
ncbi:MAG: permease-like cell division protein FtsX [Patescibacteria group bacterium]